jgi:hypothetical protein
MSTMLCGSLYLGQVLCVRALELHSRDVYLECSDRARVTAVTGHRNPAGNKSLAGLEAAQDPEKIKKFQNVLHTYEPPQWYRRRRAVGEM